MAAVSTGTRQSAAEARAAWSTMRADRRFLWCWLGVATALSVGGNVGHAWLTVPTGASRWMAIGWAVAPPVLLMLAIHGLPTLARMLGRSERDKLLTAVVWGVTVGAFVWSAFGIFGFTTLMGIPAEMAWVAPFVIDLSVFGATRGLVLTAPVAARMKVGLLAGSAGAPVPVPATAAPETGGADTPPPVESVRGARAPTSAGPVDPPPRGRASPPPAPPTSPPAAAHPVQDNVARPVPPQRSSPPRTPPRVDLPASTAQLPARVSRPSADSAPSQHSSVSPEIRSLAQDIVDSGAVHKPVPVVVAILAAAQGESRKSVIAEAAGVHHSVVTKTLEAAESRRRHQLSAVG